jgi:hypothetical protein
VFGQDQPALPAPPPAAPEAPERKPERAPKTLPRPGLAGGTAQMEAWRQATAASAHVPDT